MDAQFSQPVTQLKGIGEETAKQLQSIGIKTIDDLLHHFPYRYEHFEVRKITDIAHGENATVTGTIQTEPFVRYYGKKKSRMTVRVMVDTVLITAVFFNRAFLRKQLRRGETITITGKWDQYKLSMTVNEVQMKRPSKSNTIQPVYARGKQVTVKQLRRYIRLAIDAVGEKVIEVLPEAYLKRYKLPKKHIALREIHFPSSKESLKHARRRLVYEEFLLYQLRMEWFKRYIRRPNIGRSHQFSYEAVARFIERLPFSLTKAQHRVIQEILRDISSNRKMNRLLQGDVGSGKTVVAAVVMYAVSLAKAQSALMVPTEILAEQHYHALQTFFKEEKIEIALLTGSTSPKERKEWKEKMEKGEVMIVVGTHALIQDDVIFNQLGLVITDEQHRFGVEQRRSLHAKGNDPDVLFMTATPIPRTLAISVFGDMDVSLLDELPAGRKPIQTYWVKPGLLERVLVFIEKEIQKGRQAYVICPLIEESEVLDVQNAIDVHTQLQTHFPHFRIGLLHGQLPSKEKEQVMQSFSKGETHILVSTTVVEVGVNVPNASVMLIYDADRFGLAQLHQLRGRVGRGEHQSYCILIADPKGETGIERMRIMEETEDGFLLAEKDLELRGPGDVFGKKQSGLPEFRIADVVHDHRALETARKDASQLINNDVFWKSEELIHLRRHVQKTGVLFHEK
ncbi:ATP-dependent DNA helicase RecG [Aliibacillus thermotolerans]|uniref:ATP-dependent DNA helicase RecG n=1 Tax=Aliibacillus thermotolerans TaxID=1834418 RepID=A0ABW0U4Z2_9BACI|nr:ATP-dependent DNA helicase RecG [Aliibacillus thermotolerans]MDA3130653.1 ATP-dependent DNA helicase RecG [Aliibacillus thermotolerans]